MAEELQTCTDGGEHGRAQRGDIDGGEGEEPMAALVGGGGASTREKIDAGEGEEPTAMTADAGEGGAMRTMQVRMHGWNWHQRDGG